VQIRVGLNSGEVVVRSIGSDLHMDYTAVGQTTHLAARMEQIADPGAIVITSETLALAEGYVEVKSLGPIAVKGLADAVEVYEVTGAGSARTRLQAATRRGLTRFVGRDAEMEQLHRAQRLAGDGHGQVAAVVGEAGVGKSRFLYEFAHSHRLQGWLVLESASVSYGKGTSYLPVIQLLKRYFKIQDGDDAREIYEKVTSKLLTLDRTLEPTVPAFLALLDVPETETSWPTLDPRERRRRTLDAVKRLLLLEAREEPLLVIFEDLHWIDEQTQALLDGVVESLGSARLLLLVNYRPEYQHAWSGKTYYRQIRLDALPAASASELLEALLGDDPGLASLKQMLVKRGNPFFLEETVRTLVETKALAGERGRYRLIQPILAIQVPATVHIVLAARIDRLTPDDKRLLQTASILGKDVPVALLRAIADLPEEALRRGLDHLQAAEFLYESELYPDPGYTFKHALTHEVTYGTLLHERRRELHARVVGAIETQYVDRLAEWTDKLAHHAVRGEIWDKAVEYLRQSGLRASARSAHHEAVACLDQARQIVDKVPGDHTIAAIDIRLDVFNQFVILAEYRRGLEAATEAASLAERLVDRRRLGYALANQCLMLRVMGRTDDAVVEPGRRALAMATEIGDTDLVASTNYVLATLHTSRGEWGEAEAYFRAALAAMTPLEGDITPESVRKLHFYAPGVRAWLSWALASRGEFAEALALAQTALRISQVRGSKFTEGAHGCFLGMVWLDLGDAIEAIRVLEPALDICRTYEVRDFVGIVSMVLGRAYAMTGRVAEAIINLEAGAVHCEAIEQMTGHPGRLSTLAEVYALAGRCEDADKTVRRALSLATEQGRRADQALCLRVFGRLAAADPLDAAAAEKYLNQSRVLAAALGMRPLVAHCHLGLGKLCRRTDKREQAREHFAIATTMYREMGMTYWLDRANTELKELA
jgi:tetratricopeptide (TPR) repeat protein